ncbi:hypothetical protein, partial [Gracilinema caldarium]|uniref:hypothetical protein n=1 Tax=Gracilinema caldarium TaxID=215591 RepID=UPI0026EF856B
DDAWRATPFSRLRFYGDVQEVGHPLFIFTGVETRLRWPAGQEGGQEVRRQQAGAAWNASAGRQIVISVIYYEQILFLKELL